jgi:UMF1 family MFS transporter
MATPGAEPGGGEPGGILAKLGLRTKAQQAWAMYDWANSAMVTIIVTAVFPLFFSDYAAAGIPAETATFRHGVATTIGLAIIAVLAPVLGAMADHRAIKKRMLGTFMGVGVAAVVMMFFIGQGAWLFAAILFVIANVGASGSFVFYDALLPHVASRDEIDRVSMAGYAMGYVGGGLLLAACLAVILNPAWVGLPAGDDLSPEAASLPARLSFVAVGVWWVLFAIPLFRHVPEPEVRALSDEERRQGSVRAAISRLGHTLHELRRYRNAFLMLLAFLIYNDGIGTIIRMAGIYGAELGIERGALIGSILLVQFVGIPFAFLFGALAGWIGTKRAIFLGLSVYAGISVVGFFMTTALHFFLLAILVGMVQGGTQGLSRSLFGSMIPRHESGEFFGLFAVFEKFAGIIGPAVFSLMILLTGSSRNAILSVIMFFVIGGLLLLLVDVEEGQKAAREAEARVGAD